MSKSDVEFGFNLYDLGYVYFQRALIEKEQGNYREALDLFEQALEKGHSSSDLYYGMGTCYLIMGDEFKAQMCFNRW